MALLWRLFTLTTASLGYTRSLREVMGTTCTRFKYLFAASLLMMTAGRFLRISPPTEGSKLTHQTSARLIGYISNGGFSPFQCLFLMDRAPVRYVCHTYDTVKTVEGQRRFGKGGRSRRRSNGLELSGAAQLHRT